MTTGLKKLNEALEELTEWKDSIELAIERRENSFENKSEKWHESEKGEDHQEKTQTMQDLFDELDAELMSLSDIVDTIQELSERE